MLCTMRWGTKKFMYISYGSRTSHAVVQPYTSIQRVYENAVYNRVFPMEVESAMLVCRIVHGQYKAL